MSRSLINRSSTGYTSYLSASEIEHAQVTLTDLLELLVEHLRSPLVVSQLEGDAVMSYAFDDGFVGGQTFLESIEKFTYTPEEGLGTLSTEISMPRELVWDYLSQPEFRKLLFRSDSQEIIDRKAGRIAPGSSFQ